jgi:flagellar biosynthesis regulator FlaF
MIDIFDLIHYLIGSIIVIFFLWIIIQIHNHFSKNNNNFENLIKTTQTIT